MHKKGKHRKNRVNHEDCKIVKKIIKITKNDIMSASHSFFSNFRTSQAVFQIAQELDL